MEKVSTITTLTARRPKWQYPPPPTPRILHLPRRPRRKAVTSSTATTAKANASSSSTSKSSLSRKENLESLFGQEREFTRGVMPVVMVNGEKNDGYEEGGRRERVEERESVVMEEEKWRFQAEMLRAECNLLRMEKEIAMKKMERRRVQVERALRSAVQTLLSGREKMRDGKNGNMVLEEEIIELAEKLEKLQRRSKRKEVEIRKCSNFDKQTHLLQRRLEKFGGESDQVCVKEIQEMAEASLSIKTNCSTINEISVSSCSSSMEILRRKMEGLSKGNLLERMEEEYYRRIELPEMSCSSSMRHKNKETNRYEERACSGCKAIVQRVVEQVRAETEQWSQMQEMLGEVRNEMEELQASRDFWEDRAIDSGFQIQSLQSLVKEWRKKATYFESKSNELQVQAQDLQDEIERLKKEKAKELIIKTKNSTQNPQESPNEMEKRVLVCRLKENLQANYNGSKQKGLFELNNALRRSPFREIGNSSSLPLSRQNSRNSRAVFPLHCPIISSNLHQHS